MLKKQIQFLVTGFSYGEMALDFLNNTHQLCWIFISEKTECEMTTVGEGSASTPTHGWLQITPACILLCSVFYGRTQSCL